MQSHMTLFRYAMTRSGESVFFHENKTTPAPVVSNVEMQKAAERLEAKTRGPVPRLQHD